MPCAGLGRLDEAAEAVEESLSLAPVGADGLRWRLRSQALQLRIAHAQDGSWNKAGAENLTDVLLHANWYGTAAELMAYRADVEKDHVLAADTAALAMCLWDPITAAAATSATHSSKGLASVARAVQSLSARVPEEWHESWRSLPGIQAALDQQAPAGDEAADWHAQLDKWLDHAGLANQNTLLSPAQRRSGGIGAASPTAEKRGTAWAITVPSWPAEPRDGLPNYGWAAPHWKETQMSADVSAVLRRSALFSSLEDEELARVAGIANQRTFAAGASLIAAGDDSALGMWIVLEGEVEVSTTEQSSRPSDPANTPVRWRLFPNRLARRTYGRPPTRRRCRSPVGTCED